MAEEKARGVPVWDVNELGRLVVHLRRHGITVHEASMVETKLLAVSFEPTLGQADILEGMLLTWPGIHAVERAGHRVMRASTDPADNHPVPRLVRRAPLSRLRRLVSHHGAR